MRSAASSGAALVAHGKKAPRQRNCSEMTSSFARVVLVTAGAGGLGKGIVRTLASDGYRVAFTYRPTGTSPQTTLEALGVHGDQTLVVPADFAERGAGQHVVNTVEAQLGRLDVLVHTVGPMLYRRFERSTLADYDALVETNLRSTVEVAMAALPGMRAREFGRLIFFGMEGSHATIPAKGMSFYAAAKAGLVAFARTLAVEEAHRGITVNVIEPG
ncbi:MAG: SDR family NAD(P)-dependent oxidoreductase, partial [Candidatus Eremiobacteraeota bacterium]|nr:SDR family NAD(P)-dependent oxidoreductase [Candidatus Eremiobacteraeota bacterium]